MKDALNRIGRSLLGDYFALVVHVARSTLAFVILLLCFAIALHGVPLLFPPGELLGEILARVHVFAAMLGIIGYIVWLLLDVFFFYRERVRQMRLMEREK